MEVRAALRLPGRAGGEGDQGDVVGGGRHRVERPVGRGTVQQVVTGAAAEGGDAQVRDLGLHEVVEGAHVAQGVPDLGERADGGQLVRPLLGQHGDGDRARLQHGQPAGGQPGSGGPAQQHPVAGHHAEVRGEQMGQPVHPGAQLAVRPDPAVGRAERGPVARPAVQQFGGAVQPLGVAQLRQVEAELGPLVRRREMVAGEGVDVRGEPWTHVDAPPWRGGLASGAYRVGDGSQRFAITSGWPTGEGRDRR